MSLYALSQTHHDDANDTTPLSRRRLLDLNQNKTEIVIYCHLSEVQELLYKKYAEIARQLDNRTDWLQHRHTLSTIVAGPSCLREKISKQRNQVSNKNGGKDKKRKQERDKYGEGRSWCSVIQRQVGGGDPCPIPEQRYD